MPTRPSGPRPIDYFFAVLCFLVAGLCAFAAIVSDGPWWLPVFMALGGAAILFGHRIKPYVDEIQITDDGVSRQFGPSLRARKQERVLWTELTKVEILTTDAGPGAEDFFYLLHDSGGKGVVISNSLAVEHKLLDELHKRLPGLDHRAVVVAAGSTDNRSFTIWQKDGAGEGSNSP